MEEIDARTPDAPYVGTRPFEIGEPIFGRDQEIKELTNLLLAQRIVLLHALSGVGKTSLIKAGLIPELEQRNFQIAPVIRVNKHPGPDQPYNSYVFSTLSSLELEIPKAADTPTDPLTALNLADQLNTHFGDAQRILLVFDQFEEVLSLRTDNREEKIEFFYQLLPLLLDARYWVIFSIREDYLAELEQYISYIPGRLSARFRLEFLKRDSALEAICRPVRRFGVEFIEEAAIKLVDDLMQIRVWRLGEVETKPGSFVEPMHLQVVCSSIWEANRPTPSLITTTDVEIWGNIDDALEEYYDKKIMDVVSKTGKREQDLRDWMEFGLITSQGLRGSAREGEESEYDLDPQTIQELTWAHLVRREERRESISYELAHDRLVGPVRISNANWRAQLTPLQLKARPWSVDGKPPELLLSGADLIEAESWANRNSTLVTTLQKEYLAQSILTHRSALAERTKRMKLGTNLEEMGWGIIFAADAKPELREALQELLDHRRKQATQMRQDLYREFSGVDGYRKGEPAQKFLQRFGVDYGPAEPSKVPYYLLLVGSPEEIPFEVQYELDKQYAVGRIYFDNLEEYQSYARSVVLCESATFTLPNRAVFFGTQHPDDPATRTVYEKLLLPLESTLQSLKPNWKIEPYFAENAHKQQLIELFSRDRAPVFFFSSTHGVEFSADTSNRQIAEQGALLCQDWPGPKGWQGGAPPEFYFSAADVPEDARLLGMVAFLWGAHSAGSPRGSSYFFMPRHADRQIAKRPFLAALPKRLLGHPLGGALAVVGVVDTTWTASFLFDPETGEFADRYDAEQTYDLTPYEDTLDLITQGGTIGKAMEAINKRHNMLSELLAEELKQAAIENKPIEQNRLQKMLLQMTSVRNFILLGDPAAHLPVQPDKPYEPPPASWLRPAIEIIKPVTSSRKKVETPKVKTVDLEELAQHWVFNGLNAVTGQYTFPPMQLEELVEYILQEQSARSRTEEWRELRFRYQSDSSAEHGIF